MPRKRRRKGQRLHLRGERWYADLRDWIDVLDRKTGRHVPLIVVGEKLATKNHDKATEVLTELLKELDARRRAGVRRNGATLGEFAPRYLVLKARDGKSSEGGLEWLERVAIPRMFSHFGTDRPLTSIDVTDVRAWIDVLSQTIGHRKVPLSPQTQRHHLNALSNLFRYAAQEGVVTQGFNPVGRLVRKPRGERKESRWLEVHDAALLIESARVAGEEIYPILATLLLTGGRKREVLGLERTDVSFERRTIRFRPNRWRTLKTRTSDRSVPLWPQLEDILREHLAADGASRLLFPTVDRNGHEAMRGELRKALARVARFGGWEPSELHLHAFRHTYCAARLQTLDNGHPVSPFTVARELGHGGDSMVKAVYAHLGQVRHRSEVVEYRAEQHAAALGERLGRLYQDRPETGLSGLFWGTIGGCIVDEAPNEMARQGLKALTSH
jgi:integrase